MKLTSIKDLESASAEDIQRALNRVTIMDDLASFTKWMNDNPYQLEVNFTLGHQDRALGIHPSSVCKPGVCPLQLVYECTGEVQPVNMVSHDAQDTFDIGTAKHVMLQAMLKDMFEEQFEPEVPLRHEAMHVRSHTDGLFLFPDLRFVLEIKTIKEGGNYGFEKVQNKPLESNKRQMMMYMALSDCPFGLLFYWCKNNSAKKEHALTFEPDVWNELVDIIEPVVAHAYGDGPEVTPKVGSHCKWCKFHHGCTFGRRHTNGKSSRRAWGHSR